MQEINVYLYCEREEKSIYMFTDEWQGIEIDTKEWKSIGASGVFRRTGNMLVSVMGGISGGRGKVEKVEEVMSLGNFLTSSWDSAQRQMEAGGGEGLRNESKVAGIAGVGFS